VTVEGLGVSAPLDAPVPAAVAVLEALAAAGHRVIACSARPEDERATVASWLARHVPVALEALLLRPAGDRRADDRVVPALVDDHVRDHYAVIAVVEGRPRRAQVWRDVGLAVVGVSGGEV
jgi:hypothetical protein